MSTHSIPESSNPTRVFFLSHARTACHLLERMLSKQPDTAYDSHYYIPARLLQVPFIEHGPVGQSSPEAREELLHAWQGGYEKLLKFVEYAEERHLRSFYHDHVHFMLNPNILSKYVYGDTPGDSSTTWSVKSPGDGSSTIPRTNPTILPDSFLLHPSNRIIINTRHPLKMVPSIYRAISSMTEVNGSVSGPNMMLSGSLHWNRLLYDWLISHGMKPVIIDADEYIDASTSPPTPSAALRKVCTAIGLDPDSIITSWTRATSEEISKMHPAAVRNMKDLLNSEGPMSKKEKPGREMKLSEERGKWVAEFGENGAKMIEEMVVKTMEDYEHLWNLRITGE